MKTILTTIAGLIIRKQHPASVLTAMMVALAAMLGGPSILASGTPLLCPPFDPPTSYLAGAGARAVGIGDFNGDGKPDLAVANFEQPNVSVLLGNGDGTFQNAVQYATGNGSTGLAVADFNKDGALDLVIANYYSANLSMLLGIGNGTFQNATNLPGGPDPFWVTVGDINTDSNADLLTTSFYGSIITIQLGQGDGSFASPFSLGGVTYPGTMTLGDFNGDSHADLAVVNGQAGVEQPLANGVSVFLGNGNGTFQNAVLYEAGINPRDVVVGDFNNDSKPDLAVANHNYYSPTGSVSILLGDNTGAFGSPINNNSLGSHPISLVVGDFDIDGNADLAVANSGTPGVPTPGTVSVLLGNGDGTFPPALSYPGGVSPQTIATGDFNLDGKLDLALASSGDGKVVIMLANDCNSAPVAKCKNVVVAAEAFPACYALASIDDGSFDPDPGDSITITQTPEGPYPLGDTLVTLTVTDSHGASASCAATVTVEDISSPVISGCPSDVTVETGQGRMTCDQVASWTEPVATSCTLTGFTSTHHPGDLFPVGTTPVTYTATDAAGHTTTCSFNVNVLDTTAPVVVCTTDVASLWPPNHRMVAVWIFLNVADVCASPQDFTVECQVFSSETDDAKGDGKSTGDVDGANGYIAPVPVSLIYEPQSGLFTGRVNLRAERNGSKKGRTYSITAVASDPSGNSSSANCVVVVPHGMGTK